MKARKLLSRDLLEHLWLRYSVGVPIRKLHRDAELNMSIPVFTALVSYYEESTDQEQSVAITNSIDASLFPPWLDEEYKKAQIQPYNWRYVGKFPLGQWVEINEDD